MRQKTKPKKWHPDKAKIDALGGPRQLAEKLGYDKKIGGVQRVSNWRTRGIPPRVLLEHREIFGV